MGRHGEEAGRQTGRARRADWLADWLTAEERPLPPETTLHTHVTTDNKKEEEEEA